MRYFLTGATGFIGGRMATMLRQDGHGVVALVRSPEKAKKLAEQGVALAKGDITDPASVRAAMAGSDGVFHVAGWYKIGPGARSGEGVKINVEGTRHVLEAMRDLQIPKGVYTSTLAVFSDTHGTLPNETFRYDGPHLSEYDRTKAAAHDIADELILEGTAYCWAHVEDVARAQLLAMEKGKPGETYIIAGPPHTLVEALATAEKLTGIAAPKRRASPKLLLGLSRFMSVLEDLRIPVPDSYSSEFLRVSAGATYLGDNSKAKRTLGYAPRSLEEGLKETLAWLGN